MNIENSLSKKVIKGGFWIFTSRILERLIGFIRIVVIARLLSPEDFGLFGLLLLTLSTLEVFSQTGFHSALIQKSNDIKSYLNTVWTIHLIRGCTLYLVLFFTTPIIAHFFNTPSFTLYVRIIGLTILLNGLSNIGTIYFQKEIELSRQFIINFVSTVIEFIAVAILAYYLRNVWALVISQLIRTIANTLTGFLMHPYRPKFDLDRDKIRELFSFGKWLMLSTIITFLITQGDDAFVGKFLGVTMLGFYQMAYKIANMATTEITHVIANVTLPAFSKIHHNKKWLKESYLRIVSFTSYFSFPIAILTLLLAEDLVYVIIGDKWALAIPVIKILCVEGLIRSIGATTGPLLSGIGKPKYITYFTFIRLLLLAILIYPLTSRWGLIGTSYAVISGALLSPFIFQKVLKILACSTTKFLKSMMIPTMSTIIMSIIIVLMKRTIILTPSITGLLLILPLSIVVYFLSSLLFEHSLKYPIIKPLINTIRGK